MSHTLKDLPYDVKARRDGRINHDHRTGVCVVGYYEDEYRQRKTRNAHRKVCNRWTTTVECVHNGEREELQRKINHARAADNTYGLSFIKHPDCNHETWEERLWCDEGYIQRGSVSDEIATMVEKGYLPNCDQVKTHTVIIEDIDLGLRPGESAPNTDWWYRRDAYKILVPQYDESRTCKTCDELQPITCFIEPKDSSYAGWKGCPCCSFDTVVESKTRVRDSLRTQMLEYNTTGCISA